VKYGDEVDRKHHPKRRKRSNSDDDGSSDGERTLELASSHSSDEDEATTVHGPVRSATLGIPHFIWTFFFFAFFGNFIRDFLY
jgi:hypothetical protein